MTGTKEKKKHNKQKRKGTVDIIKVAEKVVTENSQRVEEPPEEEENATENSQSMTGGKENKKEEKKSKDRGELLKDEKKEPEKNKDAVDIVKDAEVVKKEKDVPENSQREAEPPMVDKPRTHLDYKVTFEGIGSNFHVVFENFPFQNTQRLVCRPCARERYKWFLCDIESKSNGYTLLVTNGNITPSSQPPPTSEHILTPIDSYECESNGERRQVIWYPRFKLINNYIVEILNKQDPEDQIAKVMSAYVKGLLQIHENGRQHGNITGRTMVVNGESGFLIWNPEESKKKNKSCQSEFVDMGKALKKPSSTQNSPVVQNILKGLDFFKFFLERVNTLEHCKWIQVAPFVLSAEQKVFTFIPRFHSLAHNNTRLRRVLMKQNYDWEPLVRNMGIPEMLGVLDHDYNNQQQSGPSQQQSGANQQKSNKYHCLCYLRHCPSHLNDKKKKMKGGEVHEDYSELLLKPSVFVSLIHQFGNGKFFLDDIFDIVVFKMGLPYLLEAEVMQPPKRSSQPSQTLIMPAMKVDSLGIYQRILCKLETKSGKSLRVQIPEGIFNYLHEILIRRKTIDNFLNERQLQTELLLIYMWYLASTHPQSGLKFLSPLQISLMSCLPIDVRANYVANVIKANAEILIFIAPYHYDDGHWVLLVLRPSKRQAYWIDSLHDDVFEDANDLVKRTYAIIYPSGKEEEVEWRLRQGPHQPNGDVSDSGHYMLRTMREIDRKEDIGFLENCAAEEPTYSEPGINHEMQTELLGFLEK